MLRDCNIPPDSAFPAHSFRRSTPMGLSDAQGAYLATGDPETEENTTLLYPGELGRVIDFDRGTAGAPNRCRYQQVRCAAGITPVKGQVLYWNDKSKFEVTTAAANRAQVAGIFGTQRDASAAQKYIWIGKKGRLGVLFQGAPTSAPDA